MENTKTLADYIDLINRRKHYILVTWVLVTLAAVIVAFNLPKVYRSTAKMLIEAPIPAKYIESSVSQYGEEQIQSIYQRVLSTDNVLSIIEDNDLYVDLRDDHTRHELAELFRERANVELTTSTIAPQAHSEMAEIAFNISFSHSDPIKAQEIAKQLATMFIEQNDRGRTQRAIKATDFLTKESDKLNQELQEIDSKIAQYKEQHSLSLPEQAEGNQAAIDRAENELRDTGNQIRATKERIAFLSAELARAQAELPAGLEGKIPQSKDEALRMLRAKYLQFSSIYAPSHPSLVRLKREIQALDPTFEGLLDKNYILKQLNEAKTELKVLKETYADNHPDLIKRRKEIVKLEQKLKKASAPLQNEKDASTVQSSNPAYLGVAAQYKSSQIELEALLQNQDFLRRKIENLHNILQETPQVERVYNEMLRERDNIIKKFNQLKDKWLDAKLAQTLEEQQKGQAITIIEQPVVPIHPEKAIRRKVAIGGFFMGIIVGLGVAFLVEFLEPGLRGYRAVCEVTGLMPLVVVPYIQSPSEFEEQIARQNRLRKIIVWAAFVFVMMAVVFMSFTLFELKQA